MIEDTRVAPATTLEAQPRRCARCGQGSIGCCTIWITITLKGETKPYHQACHLANHIDDLTRRVEELEAKR